MNVSGIRRNVKNIAHNYTEAQRKVRESTSNDPWGPPSSLMAEIADLTYNVVAFSEIMQMIWKRLNDHGKNWRHVYKSLVLLDYLIKTGSEKVAQQCKENIFAIQTLKDFQYYEDNKDQGLNVREKAKQLVALLKDDERLKNERSKALKARERFAQQVTSVSDPHEPMNSPSSPPVPDFSGYRSESYGSDTALSRGRPASVELDLARPQTAGEEELQLQLALAMSREEAEQEEARRRSDDVRLALAITQSKTEVKQAETTSINSGNSSHLLDLLDVNIGGATGGSDTPVAGWVDPWGTPAHPSEAPAPAMPPRPKMSSPLPATALSTPANRPVMVDPWGMPLQNGSSPVVQDPWTSTTPSPVTVPAAAAMPAAVDPWAPAPTPSQKPVSADPWSPAAASVTTKPTPSNDPWSPQVQGAHMPSALDDFDVLVNRKSERNNNASPYDLQEMNSALNASSTNVEGSQAPSKKTPENFLGPNSGLVNLDNLLPPRPAAQPPVNPFALTMPGVAGTQANPFQQHMAPRPSINQLRQQQNLGVLAPPMGDGVMMAPQPAVPWSGIPPTNTLGSPTSNPFLA